MSAKTYLGKCKTKGCGHATLTTLEDVQVYDPQTRRLPNGFAVDTTRPFRAGYGPVAAKCPDHGVYQLQPVQGRYVPDHKCDRRCTSATGPKCDCSCGGANHGAAHAA